jgi:hypothetical protein
MPFYVYHQTCDILSRFDVLEDRDASKALLITHARHRVHLESALRFIEAFLATRESHHDKFNFINK